MNKFFPFTVIGIAGGWTAAYAFSKPSKSWSKPVGLIGLAVVAFATGYIVYSYNTKSDTNVVQKTLSL